MSSALTMRAVTVNRGSRTILSDVDLRVPWGELVAVVGPNGAGKSTLLSVAAGDLSPSSGDVLVCDRSLPEYSGQELARQRAVLTQENTVAFPFTVEQVVRMGRSPWQGDPASDGDDAAVAAALSAVGMTALSQRRFTQLSGGERARASMARVLAQDTPLVLLDEPTAALDLRHQEEVLTGARELCAQGRAVVVVLHDLMLAAAYADRVIVLRDGRVVADGVPVEVLTAETLTEVYDIPIRESRHPETDELLILPRRR